MAWIVGATLENFLTSVKLIRALQKHLIVISGKAEAQDITMKSKAFIKRIMISFGLIVIAVITVIPGSARLNQNISTIAGNSLLQIAVCLLLFYASNVGNVFEELVNMQVRRRTSSVCKRSASVSKQASQSRRISRAGNMLENTAHLQSTTKKSDSVKAVYNVALGELDEPEIEAGKLSRVTEHDENSSNVASAPIASQAIKDDDNIDASQENI